MMIWQPSATFTALKKRAEVLAAIRDFFATRHVLEVETPLLCQHGVTDTHIQSFSCGGRYLQTSPEYAMKRLLAAGSGSIYQITKAFRQEEAGRFHNPEFTMLEWYRVGFDHLQLMEEVDALLQQILGCDQSEKITYQQLFEKHLTINPHTISLAELPHLAEHHHLELNSDTTSFTKDDWLQLLLTHLIEPKLGFSCPLFIYHFPASQAALAKINTDAEGQLIAERFEVYVNGMELANGFHELQESDEQRQRFEQDQQQRQTLKLPVMSVDQRLLAALDKGLPACAGVALGLDRLIMAVLEKKHLAEVIAFDWQRA